MLNNSSPLLVVPINEQTDILDDGSRNAHLLCPHWKIALCIGSRGHLPLDIDVLDHGTTLDADILADSDRLLLLSSVTCSLVPVCGVHGLVQVGNVNWNLNNQERRVFGTSRACRDNNDREDAVVQRRWDMVTHLKDFRDSS
jgi:hypothetical protein